MIVMHRLGYPKSKLYSPGPYLIVSVDSTMLAVPKVSRITVGAMEHFYFFPTGVVVQIISIKKCLKITSETM
jgi:hypothetical protein